VDYDITDEYGSFSFEDLEEGSFLIYVDYRGLPMDPANTVLVLGDGINDLELSIVIYEDRISIINLTTGMHEKLSGGLSIYPIPAGDQIMFRVPEGFFVGESVRMSILNMSGKIVSDRRIYDLTGDPYTVDISNLPEGFYIIRLSDNKVTYNLKIIRVRQ